MNSSVPLADEVRQELDRIAEFITKARAIAGQVRGSEEAFRIHSLLIDAEHDLWILRGEPND
jgi:hypothetical protein